MSNSQFELQQESETYGMNILRTISCILINVEIEKSV
jgi:hypothetical protein